MSYVLMRAAGGYVSVCQVRPRRRKLSSAVLRVFAEVHLVERRRRIHRAFQPCLTRPVAEDDVVRHDLLVPANQHLFVDRRRLDLPAPPVEEWIAVHWYTRYSRRWRRRVLRRRRSETPERREARPFAAGAARSARPHRPYSRDSCCPNSHGAGNVSGIRGASNWCSPSSPVLTRPDANRRNRHRQVLVHRHFEPVVGCHFAVDVTVERAVHRTPEVLEDRPFGRQRPSPPVRWL